LSLTIGLPGQIVPPWESIARNATRNEASGAGGIWFPDHLMGFWPQVLWTPEFTPLARIQPNPHAHFDAFLAMAAAAAATTRVKIGCAVTQPLSRHPAHLAQTFLTLSHASQGRAILGLGAGEGENLEPYGMPTDRPAAKLAEALEIIRLLWQHDEPVNFDGQFWQLRDAVLGLGAAANQPLPPIWLAALGPRLLRLAGQRADGWIPLKMPASDYAARLALIRQAGGDRVVPATWAFTVIHEDAARVDELADHPLIKAVCLMFAAESFQRYGRDHPLGPGRDGFQDYIPSRLGRDQALAAIARVPPEVVRDHLLVGTPEHILAELRSLEQAGLRHAVLWNITFLADVALAGPSFRLLEELIALLPS